MATFPALILLGVAACIAFLFALLYTASAYLNSQANNRVAFWREARRSLLAFAVLLACAGGIVAIGLAADTPARLH